MSLTAESFGALPDGSPLIRYTLSRPDGMTLRVLTYGGVVQSLEVPDARGRVANVVLGFPSLHGYLAAGDAYFGGLVGRFANRIAGGRFGLDDKRYTVDVNAGGNCLHGGRTGFDKRLWHAEPFSDNKLRLTLTSPDGDQGRMDVEVTYCLLQSGVCIDYRATTDAPTVINLTNHSYFNLAGEGSGSVESHKLVIDADEFTPVGPDLSPTGEVAVVAGTPLDLRRETAIGARLRDPHPQLLATGGYDHNYVLRGTGMRRAARRPGVRASVGSVDRPARVAGLQRQLPGRFPCRDRWAGLPSRRWSGVGVTALSGRSEPPCLPLHRPASGSVVRRVDDVALPH